MKSDTQFYSSRLPYMYSNSTNTSTSYESKPQSTRPTSIIKRIKGKLQQTKKPNTDKRIILKEAFAVVDTNPVNNPDYEGVAKEPDPYVPPRKPSIVPGFPTTNVPASVCSIL